MRVLFHDRAAAAPAGRVDGQHRHLCPAAVSRAAQLVDERRLAGAGRAATPTCTALPVAGNTSSNSGRLMARRAGSVDSINVIERASPPISARSRSARSPMTLKLTSQGNGREKRG